MKYRAALGLAWLLLSLPLVGWAQPQQPSVSGTLGAVGSDTMAGLMLRWGEALTTQYPEINVQFQASGSASAPPALLAGTTRIGPMSRRMTHEERNAFIERYGYPPLELRVARDALIVIVHRHNPLSAISRQDVDAVFSTTQACGGEQSITRWETLTQDATAPSGRIALHGRNMASGTYGLFRQRALCDGEFRPDISEYMGASAVVAAVGESYRAMGYSGHNHLTPSVKALSLTTTQGNAVPPSETAIQSGDYPLSRYLYIYVNLPPDESLPAAERAFLDLIMSTEGQKITRASGFVPLPLDDLEAQRAW
ncbi:MULTISPECIES: PstS family phosphate ABC transporter substrate-binding protein [Halomonadaceae]|uniref:Phosphate ABC transporter substrate-binding protein n=1 Tax=Vreelandella janggokensis TaxID=370767 RepID=A0ABT4IV34_9GAMM|nr:MULTISPECIES: phosphate ABC transporter substrate-binding protein [Halomonas]MCW4150831.1 phosphate ABC transporter substrate-binding protein [Halomonas sp. 18H]MCZ0927538.1 phosphate ABC transporter substrate-binding protein [Halomonas janggokensis]MCZ0930046.1 phosphate ABC transporter substrate-binding protein [Halomonas janggokensis]MDR5885790.1 phosphate ABC transporter substrate-binding protein [Halomonas janggokensis]